MHQVHHHAPVAYQHGTINRGGVTHQVADLQRHIETAGERRQPLGPCVVGPQSDSFNQPDRRIAPGEQYCCAQVSIAAFRSIPSIASATLRVGKRKFKESSTRVNL